MWWVSPFSRLNASSIFCSFVKAMEGMRTKEAEKMPEGMSHSQRGLGTCIGVSVGVYI